MTSSPLSGTTLWSTPSHGITLETLLFRPSANILCGRPPSTIHMHHLRTLCCRKNCNTKLMSITLSILSRMFGCCVTGGSMSVGLCCYVAGCRHVIRLQLTLTCNTVHRHFSMRLITTLSPSPTMSLQTLQTFGMLLMLTRWNE